MVVAGGHDLESGIAFLAEVSKAYQPPRQTGRAHLVGPCQVSFPGLLAALEHLGVLFLRAGWLGDDLFPADCSCSYPAPGSSRASATAEASRIAVSLASSASARHLTAMWVWVRRWSWLSMIV